MIESDEWTKISMELHPELFEHWVNLVQRLHHQNEDYLLLLKNIVSRRLPKSVYLYNLSNGKWQTGNTVLHLLSYFTSSFTNEMMKALIHYGVPPNHRNKDNKFFTDIAPVESALSQKMLSLSQPDAKAMFWGNSCEKIYQWIDVGSDTILDAIFQRMSSSDMKDVIKKEGSIGKKKASRSKK